MKFFVFRDDQQLGPFTKGEIEAMLARGELSKGDLACPEGGSEWQPLGAFVSSDMGAGLPPVTGIAPQAAPPAQNPNLEAEWNVYLAYSNEIDELTDLLGEADERQAKDIHKQIEHKLMISRKHIDAIRPVYPHALEVKSMEADYLFNSAVKKLWEHGFYHRATEKMIERGQRRGNTLTGVGVALASRALANRKEKSNAEEALRLLTQSLHFLEAPGTLMARANVYNALGQKQAALQDLNRIITAHQDSDNYIPARQLKAEIETPPKKGMCFIATAACGDYSAPEVVALSRFRDEVLRKSRGGRVFIYWYYVLSPSFALAIKNQRLLKSVVRSAFIKPLTFVLRTREEMK